MTDAQNADREAQRRGVATACVTGMCAIMFATDPARWPAFMAFAEQQTGEKWTWKDRERMRNDARVLDAMATQLDAEDR